MSVFLLSSTLLDELHVMLNKFWWRNDLQTSKGIMWSSWKDLSIGTKLRGMVLKNMHVFNISLLGKMGWRLLMDPNSLVCMVLRAKYFPRKNFLDVALGNKPNLTWKSIWPS
ncbi:hypothetical protein ACS0TY_021864 [Phlomoides rotata]